MARFYTVTRARVEPGITLPLTLGEVGRGRKAVPIDSPPDVTRIETGASAPRARRRRRIETGALTVQGQRVRLEPGDGAGSSVIAHVNTCASYTKGRPGSLCTGGGWKVIAEGRRAWGVAGYVGEHPDVLLGARAEAVARIVFSGGRGKRCGPRYLFAANRQDVLTPILVDIHPDKSDPEHRPHAVLERDELERFVMLALEVASTDLEREWLPALLSAPVDVW